MKLYAGRADTEAIKCSLQFWSSVRDGDNRKYYHWVDSFDKPAPLGFANWNIPASSLCPEAQQDLIRRYEVKP